MVDQFVDEAVDTENTGLVNNQGLSESATKEVQAGLNLLSAIFPDDKSGQLEVDGVFGPKTYARFKQFYVGLPQNTKKRLPSAENPITDVDGTVV